jgi:hypothetical protein
LRQVFNEAFVGDLDRIRPFAASNNGSSSSSSSSFSYSSASSSSSSSLNTQALAAALRNGASIDRDVATNDVWVFDNV